jgi:hypothetical protein
MWGASGIEKAGTTDVLSEYQAKAIMPEKMLVTF